MGVTFINENERKHPRCSRKSTRQPVVDTAVRRCITGL